MTFRRLLKGAAICVLFAVFVVTAFFGAVLQESYKLCPLTAEEIAEVQNG